MCLVGDGVDDWEAVGRLVCIVEVHAIGAVEYRTRQRLGPGCWPSGKRLTVAGSATVTPGGTSPARVATKGNWITSP